MATFKLTYKSPEHDRIREALRNRIENGKAAIANKTSDYEHVEEVFQMYVTETEADSLRSEKRNNGKPEFTTIDVPFSYAMLMSWHTYISSVFFARAPVLQFSGRHGETEQQVQAVEAIMDYQTLVGGHLVPYYLWILDAGKYGAGILGNYWEEEIRQVSKIEEVEETYLGIKISGKKKKVKRTMQVPGYQGNKLFNCRPQDFLFDSRVSLMNFQDGEFCGRYVDQGWNQVIKREQGGQYYNIAALKKYKMKSRSADSSNYDRDMGSTTMKLPDAVTGESASYERLDDMSPSFVHLIELFVELIPADWGLGQSKYPELWIFTLAEDEIIIEAQPFDAIHGKFPFSVIEYEMEAYSLQKRSMMTMLDPLNDTMSWLMNTHFFNVRQTLNGQFITDPSRITMKDFKSDGGGRLIRMKPSAYGQDVRTMFHQISTVDVTQAHLRDVQVVSELAQRISGVTDNIMGLVNAGGRKTATEVRSSNTFGMNRLKTQAEYFSAMGMAPNSQMLLQNTQQRYEGEKKFKLAGDLMDEGNQFLEVNPETIAGFFDFVPVDGTMPVDRFAQVTMWNQLLGQMRNFPEVMGNYDMGGIFAWVAQLGGLKNIKRFRINVRPDGEILSELQKGNLVNTNDVRRDSRGNGSASQNSTGVPGAASPSGMGPAG